MSRQPTTQWHPQGMRTTAQRLIDHQTRPHEWRRLKIALERALLGGAMSLGLLLIERRLNAAPSASEAQAPAATVPHAP